MTPIALADLDDQENLQRDSSDPSVFPPANAGARLTKLWAQHGDIQSARYSNPDLTSLASLVGFNARTRPNETAYLVPNADTFDFITWKQFDHVTNTAAAHYAIAFHLEIENGNKSSLQPTIALLGTGNTFRYWVTQVALFKLGVRVLLLSDKNADVARDHLLETCNAVGIVAEPQHLDTVKDVNIRVVPLDEFPTFEYEESTPRFLHFISNDIWNEQVTIIHSSGSTGLPKPIIHTNRSMMLNARMYRLFQSFIIENWYLGFPLFHIAGISIILGGLPSGLPTTFPPELWPPSPGAILKAWEKLEQLGTPADCLHCAPAVIEDLYEYMSLSGNDFSPLVNLKLVQPGGAPLSPFLLKKLVELGVNVKTTYGSTEIGPPYRTVPDTRDNPNCYHVRNLFPDSPLSIMEPLGDGLFECVVYKGFGLAAELWLDPEAPNPYRTNDLFVEVPRGSGMFALQGRMDDVLVHSNGEKTNALPLQMAIEESQADIVKVIVFGTDKPCTSAVIQLVQKSTVDKTEVLSAIIKACRPFPAFSRLDELMIVFLDPNEKLPITPKGNVRRKEAQKLYGDRVERLYADFLTGSQDASSAGTSDIDFVRLSVASVCGVDLEQISEVASFYALGLDSQKAVRLRSQLSRRFGTFPLMFIFEYPSVSLLCDRLSQVGQTQNIPTGARNFAWIQDIIVRFTSEINSWRELPTPVVAEASEGEVVYLTGATGALGNALLATLATNSGIKKVYCAIRGADGPERLAKSLQGRGYGAEVYGSGKFAAIPYDMKDHALGLKKDAYEGLASEVTIVIHNAWKMDFNQQVDMFEDDCLRGTVHLLRFAHLKTKKTFAFTSSVSTNMGKSAIGKTISESPIENDPSLALETGYAQSKFIVEVIAQTYAETLDMPVRLYRVGQLCGHTKLGSWNTSEMFPIMIATGLTTLHAMPVFSQQSVNWLPVDVCADSIKTVLATPAAENYTVHNLVNPSAITWTHFLDALGQASGVAFERISMNDWVARLQKASEEKTDIPGSKLLGFFEGMAEAEDGESFFETSKTAAMVPRLADCKGMDAGLLKLYLSKWQEAGVM